MKLVCSKSKNSATYYIQKSYRVGDKTTSKTIERLGSIEELKARAGDMDPIEWAKAYAKKLTQEEKEQKSDVIVKYSSSKLIEKDEKRSVNIGYLFLKKIYYSLGLNQICNDISDKYKFSFDLNSILSMLVYSRILYPASKRASLELSKSFLEAPNFELHQIYRALEIIAKENDYFQSQLYKNSLNVVERRKNVLYYDCTNYYFEIEDEDDFRKYGVSKEHRPNPIVQMGLFMDADGIPLSFSVFNGNENEQPSMTPLESKIISDFNIKDMIVCTDAGLASSANRKFNNIKNRKFVTTQSIKKLKGFLQDFCLDNDGWKMKGSKKIFKISDLDEDKDYEKIFYKDRWINENGLEQHLIITYSLKYRNYQRRIRDKQIDRAKAVLNKPYKLNKKNSNDYKRFINNDHCTETGEIADNDIVSLNEERIKKEEKFDGYYAVCTNLEDDITNIIAINQKRWEIEECFRIMKSEFKSRPVYLSRKDRITAHFTTCFTALIIYRILEKKINEKYSCDEIIKTLKGMNMLISKGDGYIPEYTRTDLTDKLHDTFGFRTDYQIISKINMKKICTSMKK